MREVSKIRSLVLAISLLFLFQFGSRVVFVEAQYTNSYDVLGVYSLYVVYPQLYEAVDDPCYPVQMTWVECSNDNVARITALNLGGKKLVSPLPDFSDMSALEIIDLHDNSLSGPIPSFFTYFLYLKKLDLSDNRFTGPIPSSLANNTNLVKDFSGNPGLDSSASTPTTNRKPPSEDKKSSKLPIILGIVAAVVVIAAVVGVIAIHQQRQRTAVFMAANAAQNNAPIANK